MSRRDRPELWQLAVVVAVGAAAIAFVVIVAAGVLRDGAGTGDPLDPWRAIGRELTDAGNWRIIGLSAVAGAAVTALVGGIAGAVARRRPK
ncbi:hypothetical protein M1843_02765 [Isoptericola sp. 4D.3]|uniref:Uncharacterized protein n=1 Tax=Isoptericola peretonis TaxID=2918523 RepID=A0ABT0IZI5_9MICO|nr:hypothetical protein [Isoptericola sp. 4D.3]